MSTSAPRILELPTADHRRIWDIWFSSTILPAVVTADELGIFTLLADTPLSTVEVAARLGLTGEWADGCAGRAGPGASAGH